MKPVFKIAILLVLIAVVTVLDIKFLSGLAIKVMLDASRRTSIVVGLVEALAALVISMGPIALAVVASAYYYLKPNQR